MTQSILVRSSGLILMVGGTLFTVASFSQLQPGSHYSFHGLYQLAFTMVIPAIFLLALGLAGLRVQLVNRLNRLSPHWLNLSIVGAIVKGFTFAGAFYSEALFTISIAAFTVHLFGVVLFGIAAVQTKVLPRWNALPIVIGLLPSLRFITTNLGEAYGPQYTAFASIALMGLGYALLGYLVQSDTSRQKAAA
jgi:hypothetical protein